MSAREACMRSMAMGERATVSRELATLMTPSSVSVLPSRRRGTLVPLLSGRHQLFDVDELGGIVAGVAGVAVFVLLIVAHGLAQRRERQVPEGIGFHETPDLLHAVVGSDQFAFRGSIHAVKTRRHGGRA